MTLRAPLPSGTVTLLFTDIEGSTQHWERQRTAMPAALRRHDELLRSAIEGHGGYVFKTMGDQFCAAFCRAAEAIGAACDAQRALADEDWSGVGGLAVRMALHSGTTDERDGDYFGPTVNRIARLLAVAHGGQIVVSGASALLLRGEMPDHAELRDLGEHQLKDLVEPERVSQVVAPGLVDKFPPLTSLKSLPNNLPRQVTPLVGRDSVLAEVEALALEHPLISLVGTGGVGKTRIALQAGADLLGGMGDGVWLVELAALNEAGSIVNAVASALGLREQGQRPMLDVLLQYLRSRKLLLVLDNCEHLVDEVARVAEAILRAAPNVRILATTREPLRISGEHVYLVPSLAFPSTDFLTAEEALNHGAVALFAERAKAADAQFTLSDESAPVVAEICRRLDGIPLAIELAAARVKVMAPRQLADKLDERFRLLTGGSRTALPRQQTMRALIDWSHDLLSEREQWIFRRLAIFVGGWSLEAGEAVCADETIDELDVVDVVSSLVEKSLVVREAVEPPRYRLLESTRAFALEKLVQSGERDALAQRHARWAADLADRAEQALLTAPTSEYIAEFAADVDNVRAAIAWALSHDETVLAARILGFSWIYRRLVGEGEIRSWAEAVIERLDAAAHPALAARAWHALSIVSAGGRKLEGAQRALQLGELCSEPAIMVRSISTMAFGLVQAGRAQEAEPVIDGAVRLSKENGLSHSFAHANALNVGAVVAIACGRIELARERLENALALATASGYEDLVAANRLDAAELECELGNPGRALELVRAVEDAASSTSPKSYVMYALVNGAAYRIALGDIAGARGAAREALRLARGAYALHTAWALQRLATIAARTGDARRGALLRGYVDAWYRREGYEREATEQRMYENLSTALREQLTDAELASLADEGAQLSEDQAVAKALEII